MKFSSDERKELAKIGVTSLLDLALCLPKSFDDTTLSDQPREGQVCIEVAIKSISRGYNGILNALAFCPAWQMSIKIVIFNAKTWHFGVFKANKQMIISGVCSIYANAFQITNPKIITKTGEIIPRFRTALRDDSLKKIIAKYVNFDSLCAEGLNESEAKFICDLHANDKKSIEILNSLSQEIKKQKDSLNYENDEPSGLRILKFIEIFNYIKKLSTKKTSFKSPEVLLFNIDEWLLNLPFTPTKDQLKAIDDIKADLKSTEAARRVVMGDVGSGKTLIMLAAALCVYPNVAILMAPTSILAEQIYDEALRLLPKFMSVKLVKSGDKNLDFKGVNLIIGTHVLLYNDLPSAPLVMVDEQHRFGVNQRAKIDELTKNGELRANFVQFSATPIPRTLTLIQSALVKFSFLKQMPFSKNIHSQILGSRDFGYLLEHLKEQISQNRQIIIVYPLVESSENLNYQSLSEAQEFWIKNFKNVFITHGKDSQKEQILKEFRDSGDILLSTTVVEVGISLPRLSTIVIVGAERLGLASLHQLRGRVGRNGGEGWCFLFSKLKNPPERLKEFCATLDGFKIAKLDLKNRKSGDILDGTLQHGAMFEYYDYEENLAQMAKERVLS